MDFSWALSALKAGLKVTRIDWSKRRYLWLKPATRIPADWCKDPVLKKLAEEYTEEGGIPASATISTAWVERTGFWRITTGWNPQQDDLFADDWQVYFGEGHEKQTPEEVAAYKKLMLDNMPGSPAFRQQMLDLDRVKMEDEQRKRKAEAMLDDAKRKEAFLKELDKAAIDKLPKAGGMKNCEILSDAINQLLEKVTSMPNLVASVQQGPEDKEFTITIREKDNSFTKHSMPIPLRVEGDTQFVHHEIIGCYVINPDGITKSSIGGYGLNDKAED